MKKQHFLFIFTFLLVALPVFQSNAYIIENTQVISQTQVSERDTTTAKKYNIKPKNQAKDSRKQAKILKILKWSLAIVVAIAAVYYLQGTLWLLALTLAAILGYFLSKKIAQKNAEKQKERAERRKEQAEAPDTEQPSQKRESTDYSKKALRAAILSVLTFLFGLVLLIIVLSVSESAVLAAVVLILGLVALVSALVGLWFSIKDFTTSKTLNPRTILALILSLSVLGLPLILILLSLLGI